MTSRKPFDRSSLSAIVDAQLAECSKDQRGLFEQHRVEFYQVPIRRPGSLDKVFVVAEFGDDVLYFEDVEEGFEFAQLDESGAVPSPGCSQFELRHVLAKLCSVPPKLRPGRERLCPRSPLTRGCSKPKKLDYSLTTDRLELTLMVPEDAERIFESYASDAESARFMVFATATDVSEIVAFLRMQREQFERGASVLWAIRDRKGGAFVGAIELGPIEARQSEVGFIIARAYWGRGIVPEALAAVVRFAKDFLGLRRVHGRCDVENLRSARVFEKAGFRDLGISPKSVLHPNVSNGLRDARVFALDIQ